MPVNDRKPSARAHSSPPSLRPRWLPALILLMCVSVAACSMRGTPRTPGVPPELLELVNPLPPIDRNLLQPSPAELPAAQSDDVPALIRNHQAGANLYHDLQIRHWGLVEQVKTHEAQEAERIERARKALRKGN